MDLLYMREAIDEAKRGLGFTNPNPLVGAVIVKDGKIIGRGYHKRYGDLHAERNAIINATEDTRGASMYVTLEPCSHYGKQPPCVEAIVEAGIKRVYIGSSDPNPEVNGKGIEYLKNHGVEVFEGILKEECDEINEIFFHYITKNRPYILMKIAMTADGKTATRTGHSKWITNLKSRENVHFTRKRVSAILVGINTVLIDDPMLNCRYEKPKNPLRIICDSQLRIPLDCNIVKTAYEIPTLVVTVCDNSDKIEKLKEMCVDVLVMRGEKVDINELIDELGRRKIDSVLIEGGSTIHWTMLKEDLVDELHLYIAPKMIGGIEAKLAVGGEGLNVMDDAYMFDSPKIKMFGDDIFISYKKAR